MTDEIDIVTRLRQWPSAPTSESYSRAHIEAMCAEAAKEIDRLRSHLPVELQTAKSPQSP